MSYDILFQQALSLHEAGQWSAAEQIYRHILETAPEQPDVLNLLGLIAQAKGVQTEAENLFYRAIKQAPAHAPFYYNLAFSFKLDGKPLEALENFQRALQLQPGIAAAYDEIALIYEQLGNLQAARENWQKALGLDSSLVIARANLARSYRKETPHRAIEELKKITLTFPDEAVVWYYLSQLYLEIGEDATAWNAAGKAKKLAPASDDVRVILGQLAQREGKTENARIYFEKATLLNERNIAAQLGLADMLALTGDLETAETHYRRVLELDSGNLAAHSNLAEVLYQQKRLPEALEEYRAAVIINPQSAEVSNNLGIILKDIGDYAQAAGLFFNALRLQPQLAAAEVNLAETLILLAENESEQALEAAGNWVKQMPDNVFAKHTLQVLKGEEVADNQVYSEKYFDRFADNYELVVKNLGYTVPLAMGKLAGNVEGSVVDLGCGTGLVGEVIKTAQAQITGVDLSASMLEKARDKGIYKELVQQDVAAFLRSHQGWDWMMAADVMGYIGDLSEIVALARQAGKRLIFSVELMGNAEIAVSLAAPRNDNFVMGAQGRYQHNANYVERLLQENGFENIIKQELILRLENGVPVKGMLFYGR